MLRANDSWRRKARPKWLIVGRNWHWYPDRVQPYPDPYVPPGTVPGFCY